ncbi:hypothetical protein L873DRAFT_1096634 [Choiromyces venosus 120613-1]|uniref:Uncharacterized protein n=1 Tax=Choiromyces venosus 120613-1 TaxID=1336337 RepID=A0A3N4IT41_9PEZI|nr:hypothetical protein L873DRAFT_1096681 [Choiromyces venosus 120613-1]RPA88531.1 hypothetical protein L873DRAFT_1096634 [Choiromyces venosus 120613-1]
MFNRLFIPHPLVCIQGLTLLVRLIRAIASPLSYRKSRVTPRGHKFYWIGHNQMTKTIPLKT